MSTRESICRLTLTQCIDYNKDDNQNLDLRVVHNISADLPDAVDLFHGRVRRRETIERRLFFDRPIVGVAALCCRLLCLGLAIVAFGSRRFEDGHRRFCVSVVVVGPLELEWRRQPAVQLRMLRMEGQDEGLRACVASYSGSNRPRGRRPSPMTLALWLSPPYTGFRTGEI